MSTKAAKRHSKPATPIKRVQTAMPREARAAYSEIRQGVKYLQKRIAEIQRGAGKVERKIEAEARMEIRELRKEARAQLGVLRSKEREAARTLKSLSAAAGESWREVKKSADSILSDARATAASVIDRFRGALGG